MQREQNANYYHARGACYLCLSPNDVVDTAIQIEGEGVLCICRNCIGELAQTAGFVLSDNREEVEQLKTELGARTRERDEAEKIVKDASTAAKMVAVRAGKRTKVGA